MNCSFVYPKDVASWYADIVSFSPKRSVKIFLFLPEETSNPKRFIKESGLTSGFSTVAAPATICLPNILSWISRKFAPVFSNKR